MRTMPSTMEYSLCRRRCTKPASDSETDRLGATDTEKGADAVAPDGSAATAEPGRESNALMGYNFTRFAAPVFCRISIDFRSRSMACMRFSRFLLMLLISLACGCDTIG